MDIDLKKRNDKLEYVSVETSTKFDPNKLGGVNNIESVYLMNELNSTLTKKSEIELKKYFINNKNELINILHEAILINKNDYNSKNEEIILKIMNDKFNLEFGNKDNIIQYIGTVNALPETAKNGEVYGLNKDNSINYFLYLNGEYLALMGKEEFEQNYYKKEALNLKLEELNSKLTNLTGMIDESIQNSVSPSELNDFTSRLNELKEKLSTITENNAI